MSTKIEQAWTKLEKLPKADQDIAAEAILDYAAGNGMLRLSPDQVAEVERRLSDPDPRSLPLSEAQKRFGSASG